jgi:hypothetical protein
MNQKELVEAFVRGVTRDATNYEPDRDSDFEAEFTARRVVPPLPHANGMPLDVSRREPRPRLPVWEDGRRRFEPVPKEALRSDDELGFQPSNDRKIVTYSLEKYC